MTMARKDRERIAELAALGLSAGKVAEILGTSRNAVLGEAFRSGVKFNGWSTPTPDRRGKASKPDDRKLIKPVTRMQLAKACRWMRDRGATFAEIGEIFDRDVSQVFRMVNSVAEPAPPAAAPPPRTAAPHPSKWLQYAQQVAAGVEPEAWPA
jgi:hypothetical protein